MNTETIDRPRVSQTALTKLLYFLELQALNQKVNWYSFYFYLFGKECFTKDEDLPDYSGQVKDLESQLEGEEREDFNRFRANLSRLSHLIEIGEISFQQVHDAMFTPSHLYADNRFPFRRPS